MSVLKELPAAGVVIIFVILLLFIAAAVMLFAVTRRYKNLTASIGSDGDGGPYLSRVRESFAAAYRRFGEDTNTPAIIAQCTSEELGGLLFAERFLNNAVSVFVTLGLFGTFLGLSLAVTSLTELIGYSNTSEWLSVLDSVGGGLMSALSGMGVAFYTSLVGAGCSIVLTLLRTIFSPQTERETLATALELWLDHEVAPTLETERARDDEQLVHQMISALDAAADSMEKSLNTAAENLRATLEGSKPYLVAFHQTVEKFNSGVTGFNEFDHNLRGTVERMDLAVRDLTRALKDTERRESR